MVTSVRKESVEAVVRGLVGAVNVDGGPTDRQLSVLGSITAHLWNRPDLDPAKLSGLNPQETAEQVTDPHERRCFHEVLIALEVCRHPLTLAQVESVESYSAALEFDGPDLEIFRDLVDKGAASAAKDYSRFLAGNLKQRSEPSLVAQGSKSSAATSGAEPELLKRFEAFADLDPNSLGRVYLDFHRRNRIPLPGEQASPMNHFYVAHDMTHVIAGIEPTGPGEVALSGFQWAMNDNEVNSAALLASLVVHEAGFGQAGTLTTETGQLGMTGAAELLGQEMSRGSRCTGDFSLVDHFALAGEPLAEVRKSFGVQPPDDPEDGHHNW